MVEATADLLVVAAHFQELEPLRELWKDRTLDPSQPALHMREIGVGMAAAGAGMASALHEVPCAAAVLVGSCGVYPGREIGLLSLVSAQRTALADTAHLQGRAGLPSAMVSQAELDAPLRARLREGIPRVIEAPVATTLAVTTDPVLARQLAEHTGCAAENLELLAVALACRARGVPLAAVLCCTNEVGRSGRAQWSQNVRRAAELTARALQDWLP